MVLRTMNGILCDIPSELKKIASRHFRVDCVKACGTCAEPCPHDVLWEAAAIIEKSCGVSPQVLEAREAEREFFSLLPRVSQIREDAERISSVSPSPRGVDVTEGK